MCTMILAYDSIESWKRKRNKKTGGITMSKVNYFECLYTNCFNQRKTAIIATVNETPETPTTSYNFNWDGNTLLGWVMTTQDCYRKGVYNTFK